MKYYFLIIYITSRIMAVALRGLRLKPKYEDLIGVAVSDKSYNVKFPVVMLSS